MRKSLGWLFLAAALQAPRSASAQDEPRVQVQSEVSNQAPDEDQEQARPRRRPGPGQNGHAPSAEQLKRAQMAQDGNAARVDESALKACLKTPGARCESLEAKVKADHAKLEADHRALPNDVTPGSPSKRHTKIKGRGHGGATKLNRRRRKSAGEDEGRQGY